MSILVAVAALTVLISGMCSLFEAALYSTRMATLEAARTEGKHKHSAQRFIQMKKDIAVPTSAILILNTIANTAGATLCGMYAAQVLGVAWVPAFSVVLTLAILFLGEILPKTYGATHWKSLWHLTVWPLTAMQKVFYPAIKITQKFALFFTGTRATPGITEDEIVAMIRVGGKSGELTTAEIQLLNAVFHFDELIVRQIMVPRLEVVIFDLDWPLAQCIETVQRTRHTRYPLCKGTLDAAIGLIHLKDLLGVPADQPFDLKSVMRPIRSVPETMSVSRLLREMQSTHQHMAMVVDEFGTAVGIITLENVLEQIVGAVQDEFDTEMPEIVPEGPGRYAIQGQVPIERINRELKLDLYATDVDTISGLLVSKLGRLLKPGDRVRLDGAIIEVLEAQAGRAERVRLTLTNVIEPEVEVPEQQKGEAEQK